MCVQMAPIDLSLLPWEPMRKVSLDGARFQFGRNASTQREWHPRKDRAMFAVDLACAGVIVPIPDVLDVLDVLDVVSLST